MSSPLNLIERSGDCMNALRKSLQLVKNKIEIYMISKKLASRKPGRRNRRQLDQGFSVLDPLLPLTS
jgi:hypothetical protein